MYPLFCSTIARLPDDRFWHKNKAFEPQLNSLDSIIQTSVVRPISRCPVIWDYVRSNFKIAESREILCQNETLDITFPMKLLTYDFRKSLSRAHWRSSKVKNRRNVKFRPLSKVYKLYQNEALDLWVSIPRLLVSIIGQGIINGQPTISSEALTKIS